MWYTVVGFLGLGLAIIENEVRICPYLNQRRARLGVCVCGGGGGGGGVLTSPEWELA